MALQIWPQSIPVFSEFAAQTYVRNSVEVRGRVEGYIEKWLFQPGSEVTAGQVLYVLDLRPYQAGLIQAQGNVRQSEADLEFAQQQVSLLQAEAALATAQANQIKAKQDYERVKPLVDENAASKQDLDAAVASLAAAEANLRAARANVDQAKLSTRTQIASSEGKVESLKGALSTAELNLQYATIRAPISGRIGDSMLPVGGLVTPNSASPLTTIVPLDPMWVRFKVTESEYLSWAKRGEQKPGSELPLTLVLSDGSEYPSKGHVVNALNYIDPKTGTLEIQATFPNLRHTLLPGQFGSVRIQLDERKSALAVPQRAVQQLQNISTVYTLGPGNRVEARGVTTGDRVGELWIITQGLKAGDRVIVEGQLKVQPGVLAQPSPWKLGN
jgi:membrane fusion protein (multidrug efflux system)